MTAAPNRSIRWLCRLVIGLPVVVQSGVMALGLLPMPWDFFQANVNPSNQQFVSYLAYSALCSASTIPFIAVAWKLRDPSAPGTSVDFGLWGGIKRVFLYAIGRTPKNGN